MARRPSPKRKKLAPVGGFKRTAAFAAAGAVVLGVAAVCFAASLLVRPSARSGSVSDVSFQVDASNTTTSRGEVLLMVNPQARYDLYLTVKSRDIQQGDYCSFDVEAHRDDANRYLTYTSTYFGDNVVRKRRGGHDTTETYEMDRNVHVSSQPESIRLVFATSSAWFASMTPVDVQVDVVEITPADRLLLVVTSVLQVGAFPMGLCGVVLIWLALMRQMRLIGVQVAPPGRFRPLRGSMARTEGGEA
jgi:hypothetical protein